MIAGRRLPASFSVSASFHGLLLLNFQGVNGFVRSSLTPTVCKVFFRSPMSPGFLYHQQYQPLRSLPKAVRKVLALFVIILKVSVVRFLLSRSEEIFRRLRFHSQGKLWHEIGMFWPTTKSIEDEDRYCLELYG